MMKINLLEIYEVSEVKPYEACKRECPYVKNEKCKKSRVSSFVIVSIQNEPIKNLLYEKTIGNKFVREYELIISSDFEGVIYTVDFFLCKGKKERFDELVFCNIKKENELLKQAEEQLENS